MRRRARRTDQFRDDLIAIYVHIAADRPEAAEAVLDRIELRVEQLTAFPETGKPWHSPEPRLAGMRVAVVTRYRNYLIFYRPAGSKVVEFMRVVHGAQELDRIVDEIQIDDEP